MKCGHCKSRDVDLRHVQLCSPAWRTLDKDRYRIDSRIHDQRVQVSKFEYAVNMMRKSEKVIALLYGTIRQKDDLVRKSMDLLTMCNKVTHEDNPEQGYCLQHSEDLPCPFDEYRQMLKEAGYL